jgi:hypothetical protein
MDWNLTKNDAVPKNEWPFGPPVNWCVKLSLQATTPDIPLAAPLIALPSGRP